MPSLNTRRHALGHTRVVVHPLKGKGGSYPLGVVPPLWLKASTYGSLSAKVHGQLESALEGALARHISSPMNVGVTTLNAYVPSLLVHALCQCTALPACGQSQVHTPAHRPP